MPCYIEIHVVTTTYCLCPSTVRCCQPHARRHSHERPHVKQLCAPHFHVGLLLGEAPCTHKCKCGVVSRVSFTHALASAEIVTGAVSRVTPQFEVMAGHPQPGDSAKYQKCLCYVY
jgi:hypothetical protein